jgi:hypothetical protein
MTYEASTSLSIFLGTVAQSKKVSSMPSLLKNGLGIMANSVVFILTPSSPRPASALNGTGSDVIDFESVDGIPNVSAVGDVMVVRSICLDLSMWRLGGAAIPLRLVQLANVRFLISHYENKFLMNTSL